jgi:hypothetical protein
MPLAMEHNALMNMPTMLFVVACKAHLFHGPDSRIPLPGGQKHRLPLPT